MSHQFGNANFVHPLPISIRVRVGVERGRIRMYIANYRDGDMNPSFTYEISFDGGYSAQIQQWFVIPLQPHEDMD